MEKTTTKKDWKDTANKRRTRGLIANGLIALFEVHDEIPVAQHIMNILRPKKDREGEPNNVIIDLYVDDAAFLKAMESYTEELQRSKMEEEEE